MSVWTKNKFFIIWLIVAIFAIAILRLPNYQRELINWDEHTFMLSGADLLDGNLPYIKTLDNKPPFLYVNVALAFILFGRSVIGFRIFGDLCILAVSVFIFLIGRRLFNERTAAYGALSFIALTSAPFAAHTSSEIIALVYLMAALWILFNFELIPWLSLMAGLLMSFAILVRTNLILLAACAALVFVFEFLKTKNIISIVNLFFYVVGGIIPLIFLVIIYWSFDKLEYLKLGLITIPFMYSGARRSVWGSILRIGYKWLEFILMKPLIVGPVTALLILSIYLLFKQFTRDFKDKANWRAYFQLNSRTKILLVLLLYLAAYVSIIFSGKTYAHYQIQLFPFVSLLIGLAFYTFLKNKSKYSITTLLILSIIVGVPSAIATIVDYRENSINFEGLKIADSIAAYVKDGETIWAINQHIVLFYLDQDPIIPLATHPSNLTEPSYVEAIKSFDPALKDPFLQVLELNPQFIITPKTLELDYFNQTQNHMFKEYINENYELVYFTEHSGVYKRISE